MLLKPAIIENEYTIIDVQQKVNSCFHGEYVLEE